MNDDEVSKLADLIGKGLREIAGIKMETRIGKLEDFQNVVYIDFREKDTPPDA